MPTYLAVESTPDELRALKARVSKGGITLLASYSMPLQSEPTAGESAEFASPERPFLFEAADDDELDGVFSIISSGDTLTERVYLPFRDEKRIDLIAPIQLEDLLPFDLDPFIVDSIVTGEQNDRGEYSVLSCLALRSGVERLIGHLKLHGAEPRSISTRASALSRLPKLDPMKFTGSFAILGFHREGCSLAVFVADRLLSLRECPLSGSAPNFRAVLRDVLASLEQIEVREKTKISRVVTLGAADTALAPLQETLGRDVELYDPLDKVEYGSDVSRDIATDFAWALGLFAGAEEREGLVDFRKGDLAYKATLFQIRSALLEEYPYFVWALVFLAFWYGSVVFHSRATYAKIERTIAENINRAMPGEPVPLGGEVSMIEGKVRALEEQLSGMGTLASLSPLGSLRELSEAIPADVDVAIDSMNVSQSRVTLTGSVPDNVVLGRLSGALEKRVGRFCDVKLDPKGRTPGSARVQFVAEIQLCQ